MCATPSSAPAARRLRRLPPGAVVGSSSLRRQAQVKRLRPDLRSSTSAAMSRRGIAKLERGMADATLLALAGLKRLGLAGHVTSILSTEEMLPAVAQGAIGIACRSDDATTRELLQALNDRRHRHRGRLRARLSWRTRRILPHADRRSRRDRRRGFALSRARAESRRHASGMRSSGLGARRMPRASATSAGRELLALAGPDFLASLTPRSLMRLLVTRPEPDATRQAEILAARGHEPVVAPLLLIEPATETDPRP